MALIRYLPPIMQDVREFKAIMDAEDPEFMYLIEILLDYVLDNTFISTAREDGLDRYEKILGIQPKDSDNEEIRRFRILSLLSGDMPYTYFKIAEILSNLCGHDGYKLQIEYDKYKITVKVALTAKANFEVVRELLGRILPANMIIEVELLYNQYKAMAGKRHIELGAFKHGKIREEVL